MTIRKTNESEFKSKLRITLLAGLMLASLVATGHALERLAGNDRFSTAAEISRKINSENGTIILANARSYVDALSGGSLASASQGRILLVEKDLLPSNTMD